MMNCFCHNMRKELMKKILFCSLALLLVSAASAQTHTRAMPEQNSAERYIRKSEGQWAEAIANGDVSVVQRILADDFIGVDPDDGHLYDKAEAISWIREHHQEFVSSHLEQVKIRFFGNTAIAQGSESWERRNLEPRRGRFEWSYTCQRRKYSLH